MLHDYVVVPSLGVILDETRTVLTQPAVPRFTPEEVSRQLGAEATFLGAGAFGDTWKVGNEAVKIICADDPSLARLAREVEGLRRVSSPHVVAFHGPVTVQLGGKDRPGLRFEYIAGGDLEGRLSEGELLPVEHAEDFLRGLLTGVHALHKAATIHRDIKPANVVLRNGRWQEPVLLDLGLAKQIDWSTITIYPGHIGTFPYMAPEQLIGQRARKAADLWAIGVTVRHALTGSHPFYKINQKYTVDEAYSCLTQGPKPLPENCPKSVSVILDRLTSMVEHERGSVSSNLIRLSRGN
ncbi:serine/threonine protein kinase [Streptomyces canus]|uniref:non-specific serine/threonine protein kinase n=1 Tax=Streptomyces canus TaxID=58343 RepID=A0AAW8FHW1_9ACTN|nr:serine/threonine-protein kinase [Streptomyces canus]MDQ0909369.1 serine/threonine protein kinase [Streptomyces canus]